MALVTEWFYENLDRTRINLDLATFAFRFTQEHRYSQVSLSESGRGTQALLPVVALLKGISQGLRKTELAIVEEPEEHLHPSAHGAVADLLIDASRKTQVLIETHSENLILRLRRRVAEKRIDLDEIALYYIHHGGEVVKIELDSTGSAINWPIGVFENDIEEAQAIIDAKIAALDQ
jgi:predicted ATPase